MNDIKYCAYLRKSLDSEDRQVQSIEDQEKEVEQLAKLKGIKIIEMFKESKTAKKPGRPIFNEMMCRIKAGEFQGIACYKLNRLARNPICGSEIQWLLQQGIIKSILTPSREYLPTDNVIMMAVEFGMANQFILDLSKDVKRGMRTKVDKGWRPHKAPLGYLNDKYSEKGNRKIFKDSERFDLVRKMWDLLLTGNFTIPKIVEKATNEWGLRAKGGDKISLSRVYHLFTNSFYYGEFTYNNEIYKGKHDPMITEEEFDKAQMILGQKGKPRPKNKRLPFNGIIKCSCGGMITSSEKIKTIKSTGETKRYIYHHCSRRKKDTHCKEPAVTHENLKEQIEHYLDMITIPEEFLSWATQTLREQNELEQINRNQILTNLHNNHQNCVKRIDNLINLYINPENSDRSFLNEEEFKNQKNALIKEKSSIEEEMRKTEERVNEWVDLAEKTFHFATYAKIWFDEGNFEKKTQILNSLGQNFWLKTGELFIELKKSLLVIKKGKEEAPIENVRLELAQIPINKEKSPQLERFISIWSR